jgi:trk system potassium uptake protein TrkA
VRIVIVGNGKIGRAITERLAGEGHDLTVIDVNEQRVAEMQDEQDIMTVLGNGAVKSVQEEAGVPDADVLIAAANSDELNLLCCLIAKKLGAKSTVARVRNPEYSEELAIIREDLGLSLMINPEFNAAQEIFSVLRFPGVLNVDKFAKGKVELAEFRLPKNSKFVQMSLHEIGDVFKVRFLVCAVRRGGETFIPRGGFVLEADDHVSFLAPPAETESFLKAAGIPARPPKKVIIIGAGRISYYLARMLKTIGVHPTVIDNDLEKCQVFSDTFPDCLVLHGDGSDRELLAQEGIDNADAFVTTTGTDEVNILLSMYATSRNVPKVVTKVSRYSMLELIGEERVGSVISPKTITADQVTSYVRAYENSGASNVETLYRVVDDTVEALEFVVREDDPRLLNIPFKDLRLKKDLLIGCILREGRLIIPNGSDSIRLGDRLIVVTTTLRLNDLHNILA